MADTFIWSASDAHDKIKLLVGVLELQNWSVFWDPSISSEKTYSDTIAKEFDEAKCIIVVWTKESVQSPWINGIAKFGLERNILVPVQFEDVDTPFLLGLPQAFDLSYWTGRTNDILLSSLLGRIREILHLHRLKLPEKPQVYVDIPVHNQKEAGTKRREKKPEIGTIFISYSRKDQTYVKALADHLENEGLSVWLDDKIEDSEDWWDTIEGNINNCSAMVIVMTPESRKRKWVKREFYHADDIEKPIFPLLLDGKCFSYLKEKQFQNVIGGSMPPKKFIEKLKRVAKK